eukprot:GHVP01066364.1.p1 GENE.GHVP01066364.1~~GHVP01066364.1.p1  ORF type:complete len:844 (-),score=203.43 GHVP01066364.1:265-2796(-)
MNTQSAEARPQFPESEASSYKPTNSFVTEPILTIDRDTSGLDPKLKAFAAQPASDSDFAPPLLNKKPSQLSSHKSQISNSDTRRSEVPPRVVSAGSNSPSSNLWPQLTEDPFMQTTDYDPDTPIVFPPPPSDQKKSFYSTEELKRSPRSNYPLAEDQLPPPVSPPPSSPGKKKKKKKKKRQTPEDLFPLDPEEDVFGDGIVTDSRGLEEDATVKFPDPEVSPAKFSVASPKTREEKQDQDESKIDSDFDFYKPENLPANESDWPEENKSGNKSDQEKEHLRQQLRTAEARLEQAEVHLRSKIESELQTKLASRFTAEKIQLDEKIEAMSFQIDELSKQLKIRDNNILTTQEEKEELKKNLERKMKELQDKSDVLNHAKEMWIKESSRAMSLAETLDKAEMEVAKKNSSISELRENLSQVNRELESVKKMIESEQLARNPLDVQDQILKSLGIHNNDNLSEDREIRRNGVQDTPMSSRRYTTTPTDYPTTKAISPSYDRQVTDHSFSAASESRNHGRFHSEKGRSIHQSHNKDRYATYSTPAAPPVRGNSDHGLDSKIDFESNENFFDVSPSAGAESEYGSDTLASSDNLRKFRNLVTFDKGELYSDGRLQFCLSAEFEGLEGRIFCYIGNFTHSDLHSVEIKMIIDPADADNLHLATSPLPPQLPARDQVEQRISVSCIAPYYGCPQLLLSYLLFDNTPVLQRLSMPIPVSKFMSGKTFSKQEFLTLWRSEPFVLKETSGVVNIDRTAVKSLLQLGKAMELGGALKLLHGFDTQADNLVASGVFPPTRNRDPNIPISVVLARCEMGKGSYRNVCRLSVRSDSSVLAASVRSLIKMMIGTADDC